MGSAASFTLLGLAQSLAWLFVARILAGVAGGSITAAKSYIADVTTPENRAKGMGFLGAGIALGYVFGPAIGGVLMQHAVTLPYFVAASIALLNCVSALCFLPAPPQQSPNAGRASISTFAYASQVARHPRLRSYLVMVLLMTLSFSLFTGTFALLSQHRFAFAPMKIGLLLSFVGLMAAIVQGGLIGPLVKQFRELPLAAAGAAFFAMGIALVPFGRSLPWMFLALFFVGFGNSLEMPTLMALISHEAAAGEQGRLLGLEQGLESVARIVGLVLGGWLYAHANWTPYAAGAALMTATFVLALAQLRHRAGAPAG
jgi:predicted MFS family arabinose efflux permease